MLFAVIVKQNHDKAWKSLRHEDGKLCFGGGWFIVGIDTPYGSYTYHYENKYFDLFDCEILDYGKHWDGHTEKDVTRLLSLPKTQLSCEGTTYDLISRRAAIDALNEYFARIGKLKRRGLTEGEKAISLDTVGTIKTLPPAQPEPKEGRWINGKCDLCGEHAPFWCMASTYHESNYCPNCGARMKGEPNERTD